MGAVAAMEKKIITVSEKRQITLPIKFFNSLNIQKEVECYVEDGNIVLKPIRREESYFAKEILAELVAEGFSGQALLSEFDKRQNQIRGAVGNMIEDAERKSANGELATYEDIFGTEL